MGKWIQIDVTEDDIKAGNSTCEYCPVALALRRTFPRSEHISVEAGQIYVDDEGIDMPDRVSDFVDAFDWSQAVKPFSFKVPPRFRQFDLPEGGR